MSQETKKPKQPIEKTVADETAQEQAQLAIEFVKLCMNEKQIAERKHFIESRLIQLDGKLSVLKLNDLLPK